MDPASLHKISSEYFVSQPVFVQGPSAKRSGHCCLQHQRSVTVHVEVGLPAGMTDLQPRKPVDEPTEVTEARAALVHLTTWRACRDKLPCLQAVWEAVGYREPFLGGHMPGSNNLALPDLFFISWKSQGMSQGISFM